MAEQKKEISIIVPAYNEAVRIKKNIVAILSFLDKQKMSGEVIVVCDGSKDDTPALARQIKDRRLTVLSYHPNQGKGYAVRTGMRQACGDIRMFIDADLTIPITEVKRFVPYLQKFDIVIGSKALQLRQKKGKQKPMRIILGRGFNLMVRMITGLRYGDTQCGFKMFSKRSAERIFSKVRVRRFGFDVEVLYLAKKFRFRVKELPVTLQRAETSQVSVVSDSLNMLKDMILIRYRDFCGKYR